MKKQIVNPFLPIGTYNADCEPHVFDNKIYVYGSCDKENGSTYCELNYEFYSAFINDLTNWSSNGINYKSSDDPDSIKTNRKYLYASDCVKGNDGKYYLYYELGGEKGVGGYYGPIGVAVSDTPDGKFEFLGYLKNPDGSLFDGGYIQFDPGVINDDGIIRIYYGTYYPFDSLPKFIQPLMEKIKRNMFHKDKEYMKKYNGDVMGPVTCEIANDMLTVMKGPTRILPVHQKNSPITTWMDITGKDGHYMKGHGFFEASSIRKINNLYYFIYSSVMNHELCYATSKYPDKDFTYRGVIISNGDIGYQGRLSKDRVNITGNIHGSIEKINEQWYVFYHRHSHYSDYSRLSCAEKITILEDGSIPQVEVTSCGLNDGDLLGSGTYDAGICCNLTNGKMPHLCNGVIKKKIPMICAENNSLMIKNMSKNTYARYKYFDLSNTSKIKVLIKGKGVFGIITNSYQSELKQINDKDYTEYEFDIKGEIHDTLQFYCRNGRVDVLKFDLRGDK